MFVCKVCGLVTDFDALYPRRLHFLYLPLYENLRANFRIIITRTDKQRKFVSSDRRYGNIISQD
jgi:hypothetical protein